MKRYLPLLLVAFVALDLAFTCWQSYQMPMDGDLVAIVLPAPWYAPVLHDPFGWAALTKHEVYAAPNRFFAHAAMGGYWKTVPRLLHSLTNPISSLYAAGALFTTVVQALVLLLLAAYVRQAMAGTAAGRGSFWVAAALLVPLFQTNGYNEQMGITNRAVTYTFFYALPMGLLLLLLWPFYRAACRQQPLRVGWMQAVLLLGLMVVIAFNGPVATASVAIVLLGIALAWTWEQVQARRHGAGAATGGVSSWLSGQAMGLLGTLGALCLYSIYIGRNNSENNHDHSLGELYRLLPVGVVKMMAWQAGLPILAGLLLLNYFLVNKLTLPSVARQRVLLLLRWVAFFAVMYVLLLPFGGYRSYRPYLLRNDSALPVLLTLLFAYGLTTYYLLFQLTGRLRAGYLGAVLVVGVFFMYADRKVHLPDDNGCERWSLDQLSRAPEPVVQLSTFCNVLSWSPIGEASQSDYNAQMLQYWGITPVKKLYYNK